MNKQEIGNNTLTKALHESRPHLLLGRDTHGLAEAASGLGVLSAHLQVPVVAETAIGTRSDAGGKQLPHLLQTVEILTEVGLEVVGHNLLELASLHVLLSVQEPLGDVVLQRVADHGDELIDLLVAQLTSATP